MDNTDTNDTPSSPDREMTPERLANLTAFNERLAAKRAAATVEIWVNPDAPAEPETPTEPEQGGAA